MIDFLIKTHENNPKKLCPNAMKQIPNIYNTQNHAIHSYDTNCWSTTLFTVGASDIIKYVGAYEIKSWLETNTKRISKGNGKRKRSFGDILVVKEKDDTDREVLHTAIYIEKDLYWHQVCFNGSWEILSLQEVLNGYHAYRAFYHVKPKPRNQWKEDFDFLVKTA